MTTDPDNDFLFTGTTMGQLKIWLMTNYGYVYIILYPYKNYISVFIYQLFCPVFKVLREYFFYFMRNE